jgi:hypothetical protein
MEILQQTYKCPTNDHISTTGGVCPRCGNEMEDIGYMTYEDLIKLIKEIQWQALKT